MIVNSDFVKNMSAAYNENGDKMSSKGENMYCYRPNQPRPIFCRLITPSANVVVNPLLPSDFGFFNNVAPGTIENQTLIPLTLVEGQGTNISESSTTTGAIALLPGTYQISYMANGVTPTGENVMIELQLNGTEVSGSGVTASGTTGTSVVLGQTIALDVASAGTLELVNMSGEATEFSSASITISRL